MNLGHCIILYILQCSGPTQAIRLHTSLNSLHRLSWTHLTQHMGKSNLLLPGGCVRGQMRPCRGSLRCSPPRRFWATAATQRGFRGVWCLPHWPASPGASWGPSACSGRCTLGRHPRKASPSPTLIRRALPTPFASNTNKCFSVKCFYYTSN